MLSVPEGLTPIVSGERVLFDFIEGNNFSTFTQTTKQYTDDKI